MNLMLPTEKDGEIDIFALEHVLSAWETALLIKIALHPGQVSRKALLAETYPEQLHSTSLELVAQTIGWADSMRFAGVAKLVSLGLVEDVRTAGKGPSLHLCTTAKGYEASCQLGLLMEGAGLVVPTTANWHHRPG